MRRRLAYSSNRIASRRAGKTRYEAGQFNPVRNAQERAAITHCNLRILGNHIGPLGRHRANARIINSQQEPLAVAIEALADAGELLATQRVKGVGNADKVRRSDGNVCIPNGVTKD